MWKEKLKAIPKGVGASILAVGAGTALTLGLLAGGGTFASWTSGSQLVLDSSIQIDWEDPTPPTITTENLAKGFIDEPYSNLLEGEGSGVHSVSAGALPDGLKIDPKSGAITGTPTKKGVYTFTVTKTNKVGEFSKEFSIEVAYGVPTITTESLEIARKGATYNQQIQGTGGGATYSISGGELPNGLTLDSSTGLIKGTATTVGIYPITVSKTNESGSIQKSYELEVKLAVPKFLNGVQLWSGNLNVPYNRTLSVEGEEILFSSNDLPAWLSLNPVTGALTGTPPEMKSYYLNVTISNSGGSASKQFFIVVNDTPPIFVTETLPDGEVGIAYNGKVELLQANASFVSVGGLPSGLSFNRSTGEITGTPRFSGTFDVTFNATRDYINASKTISIYIETDGPTITTKELPNAFQNTSYYQVLTGKGENSAYQITSGALPGNLSMDSTTGRISGNPGNVAHGIYTFTVTKTNEKGVAFKELSIYVSYEVPALGTWYLSSRTIVDTEFTVAAPVGKGNGSTYSIVAGTLPDGVILDPATGILSGKAAKVGSYPLTMRKENESGFAERSGTLTVVHKAPTLTTKDLPVGTVGVPYSFKVEATGEDITYTTSIPMPDGFTLDPKTGVISGYSDVDVAKTIRVYATNSGGSDDFVAVLKIIQVAPTFVSDARLPSGSVGVPYSYQLQTTGNNVSFSFPQGGSLPAGLSLNTSTGLISGTPTTAINDKITNIAVINSGGREAKNFYMTVTTQPPTITYDSFPDAIGGKSYSQNITGEGTGNTWSITSGALPKPLSLHNLNGVVAGTPTEFGLFNFTITKTNGSGSVSKAFTLKVGYEIPTITNTNTENVNYIGSNYNFQILGSGYGSTFSVTKGSLPNGLSIGADGRITGKPTETGVFVFTITRGNPESSASKEFTFTVTDAKPTLPTSTTVKFTEGTQIDYLIGGTGENVTYSLSRGSVLPEGLSLEATTGRITGVTTDMGNKTVYITKANSFPEPVEVRYTYSVVYAAPVIVNNPIPNGKVGTPYSAFIYAEGKEINYSLTSALPAGLTLNPTTGEISGTPTRSGTFRFYPRAENSGGTNQGSQLTLVIAP